MVVGGEFWVKFRFFPVARVNIRANKNNDWKHEEMSKPEIDYQFTPIPSEALERLAEQGLAGREFRIIFVLWRKTWGWSKEAEKIPMSQFHKYTGIDRRKCHAILTGLVNKRIIKKSVTARGDRKIAMYQFNEIYSEWKMSPPKGTVPKGEAVPLEGHGLSPSAATDLSPSAAYSINKNRNLLKESAPASDLLEDQAGPNHFNNTMAKEAFEFVREL